MKLPSLISFVGFTLLIAATWCPMLRPFHLLNWDVYDLNKPYGMVILLVAVVGVITTVFNLTKVTRLTAWLSLGLVIVFYLLAILKVKTEFSFIPLHSFSGFLSKQIKFQWGWYLLFASAMLSVAGTLSKKTNLNTIKVNA
jgi:polyferredoxin